VPQRREDRGFGGERAHFDADECQLRHTVLSSSVILSTAYQVGDDICILYRCAVVEQGNRLLISSIPVPDPRVKWDTSVVLPVEEEV
jgi:hypothetical protein